MGLIEQRRWKLVPAELGQKHQLKRRAYEDQESFKWQRAGQAVRARLGEALSGRVIAVCDREADISEYLHWQRQVGGRYVVRAAQDRNLAGAEQGWWHTLEQAPYMGMQEAEIPQRGGRPARRAQVSLRAQVVEIAGSVRKGVDSLRCQALLVREEHAPAGVEALEWLLLTTEAVTTRAQALDLLWIYGRRWERGFSQGLEIRDACREAAAACGRQSRTRRGHLGLGGHPVIAIAGIGVPGDSAPRTTPTRTGPAALQHHPDGDRMVRAVLAIHQCAPPAQPPSAEWAYRAIAKLGGWMNTQRTGRPGWQTIWYGMFRLAERRRGTV